MSAGGCGYEVVGVTGFEKQESAGECCTGVKVGYSLFLFFFVVFACVEVITAVIIWFTYGVLVWDTGEIIDFVSWFKCLLLSLGVYYE